MSRKFGCIKIILLWGFLFPIFSQSFHWQADTTIKYGTPGNTILFHTYLSNNTTSQESLRVIRTQYNFPAGWSSSFCIGGISGVCYAPFIDTIPDPVVLNTSEILELAIDVQTSSTPDQCDFVVRIENWSNPTDVMIKSFTASTYPNFIEENNLPLMNDFYLYENYPNPFNLETAIRYELKNGLPQSVKLMIYNNHGQPILTLVNRTQSPGSYRVCWDGKNARGQSVPSGIYYYQLSVGRHQIFKKMTLIK